MNMKVNFKKLNVEVAFDKFKELDIAQDLGNYIHASTSDIGLDDTARAIYHSEGEVEISDDHAKEIVNLVMSGSCLFLAAIKKAVEKTLRQ